MISSGVSGFDLVSHRALGFGEKENTIAAIRQASALGASFIELDIRQSVDGVLYVFHDAEIQDVDLKGKRFEDIKKLDKDIPALIDVFKQGNTNMRFLLDMKESSLEIAKNLKDTVLLAEIPQERLYVQSAEFTALAQFKQSLPDANFVKLARLKRRFPWLWPPPVFKLVQAVESNGIQIVNMKGRSFIDREYVGALKKAGVKVYVWTINSPDRINFYRKAGVDGVVTDIFQKVK